jgi:hypothetical protein
VNTPAFLLAAAILFWGWQTGLWLVAVPLAIVFEAPRIISHRLELAPERLDRASDLCVALAIITFGYFYATAGNPKAITQLFLWLPVAYVPLALAQSWSTAREFELSTLLLGLRGVKSRRPIKVNIGYVYAALWVVGAAAANRRDYAFEIGAFVLAAWALWTVRPVERIRPGRMAAWAVMIATAGAIGFAAHTGLRNLQNWIEGNIADWIGGDGTATNPYRADTDIGRIGEIKQSEKIVMRVRAEGAGDGRVPGRLLLHRASYDAYSGVRWRAKNAAFATVKASADGLWPLGPAIPGETLARLAIVEESTRANPVLSLPAGTRAVAGLQANEMKRNPLGAIQVDLTPGFFRYEAQFATGAVDAAGPGADDLAIPRAEAEAVGSIAQALGLEALPPAGRIRAVERFFSEGFRYTLFQPGTASARSQGTALIEFLRTGRAGHCEYFASATALLLRSAAIPARYATGFAVLEWSPREGAYLVRARHAHSWVRAWIDGRWIDVDTTPPSWAEIEAKDAPWWSGLSDLWNWLRYQYAESQREGEGPSAPVIAVFVVLAIWVGWRLFGRAARSSTQKAVARKAAGPEGVESAFRRIEERLAQAGLGRRKDETAREWVRRLRSSGTAVPLLDEIDDLAWSHTRHRFDPRGLSAEELQEFSGRVGQWLATASKGSNEQA